jgi:hypothetical protein
VSKAAVIDQSLFSRLYLQHDGRLERLSQLVAKGSKVNISIDNHSRLSVCQRLLGRFLANDKTQNLKQWGFETLIPTVADLPFYASDGFQL